MIRYLLACAALALAPCTVAAQEEAAAEEGALPHEERAEDVISAMRGALAYDEVFAQSFRDQVPEDEFRTLTGQLESQFGAIIGIEEVQPVTGSAGRIVIRLERALAIGNYELETSEPYLVAGLLLQNVEPIDDSVEALIASLGELPGETSLLITPLGGGEPIAAHNADVQMALGSTFKLYVLSALARSIAAGEHSWDELVPLTERSFPSGQMQDWPEGAPVTIQTLATLMISISDNTATDQLMAILGRDAVEAEVIASGHSDPAATLPFMTTREMFVLKSGSPADVEAYRAMDAEARLAALEDLADVDRTLSQMISAFTGGPNAIDIEWFATGEDVARIFERLRDVGDPTVLDILSVNTALPDAATQSWDYVGYKGGSEPGVLNMSWMLRNSEDEWFVVTMGWNNTEARVSLDDFQFLAMRAIALAAGE